MSKQQPPSDAPAEHAPVLALVTAEAEDEHMITRLLAETALSLRVRPCRGCSELRDLQAREPISLVAHWQGRTSVHAEAVRDEIASWAEPPVLLLVAERVERQHYHRASQLNARGVIDVSDAAGAAFVIERELGHARLLHRFNRVHRQLMEQRIVDESAIAAPVDSDHDKRTAEAIDQALRNDGLELLFQPIVALKDDTQQMYEVFTRIHGPGRVMEPAEFLPVAERYGLMPAIDRWVVRAATRRYTTEQARRGSTDRSLSFFLNISAPTLVERPSMNRILLLLAGANPAPGAFVLELDKSTIMSRLELAKSLNYLIKRRQLAFAIDQYDQEDARLNYTRHVSVDYIKLSRAAVEGIDRKPKKRAALEELIASAHEAGLRVIATQVEHTGELMRLYQAGVDYVQGYLVAAPSPHVDDAVTNDAIFG